jgi:hypothetical protein
MEMTCLLGEEVKKKKINNTSRCVSIPFKEHQQGSNQTPIKMIIIELYTTW